MEKFSNYARKSDYFFLVATILIIIIAFTTQTFKQNVESVEDKERTLALVKSQHATLGPVLQGIAESYKKQKGSFAGFCTNKDFLYFATGNAGAKSDDYSCKENGTSWIVHTKYFPSYVNDTHNLSTEFAEYQCFDSMNNVTDRETIATVFECTK
jgi:hypothetical protein